MGLVSGKAGRRHNDEFSSSSSSIQLRRAQTLIPYETELGRHVGSRSRVWKCLQIPGSADRPDRGHTGQNHGPGRPQPREHLPWGFKIFKILFHKMCTRPPAHYTIITYLLLHTYVTYTKKHKIFMTFASQTFDALC